LTDGKNGKPFKNKVFVGTQYMLRLMHDIEKKNKARSTGSYDQNMQPGSGKEGGQSLDPMLMYSLVAHGAKHNLRDATLIKGQQNDEFWRALQTGAPLPTPEKSFAWDKFITYLQNSGVNIEKRGNNLVTSPFLDKHISKISSGKLEDAGKMLQGKNLSPEKGGLFDPDKIGGMSGSKWAHIELNEKMPHPLFEKAIQKILGITAPVYKKIMDEEYSEDGLTGSQLLESKLNNLNLDKEIELTKNELNKAPKSKVNVLNKKLRHLNALQKSEIKPSELLISKFPVMPSKYRPVVPLPSGDLRVSPINHHYKNIAVLSNSIKTNKSLDLGHEENKNNRIALYRTLKEAVGTSDPLYAQMKNRPGLIRTLTGSSPKEGFIQNVLWGKRQDVSARSTITVDPTLGVDEAGIPIEIAKKTLKPFIIKEMVTSMGLTPVKALEEIKEDGPFAREALKNTLDKRPILLNRAPTLHKHGIQAFRGKLTSGKDIKINPIIVGGFNADFDGDQMALHVPVSDEAVNEAYGLLPSKNVFKTGDNSLVQNISKDYQLGLYFLTKAGKETNKRFKTVKAAQAAGLEETDVFNLDGKRKTTIGREAVNSILPPEHRDYTNPFDSKKVRTILEEVGKKNSNDFSKVVSGFKDLGNQYGHSRATTVSINDLIIDESIKKDVLDKYEKSLPKNATSDQIVSSYIKAKKELADTFQSKLTGKNRFYDWIESGGLSKSKSDGITQILGMPGILTNTKGEPVPIPITKGYGEGLDSHSYFTSMYGVRKGTVDRAVNTQESGALNKRLLGSTRYLIIKEHDCGTKEGVLFPKDDKNLLDRALAKDYQGIGKEGDIVSLEMFRKINKSPFNEILVRSPLTCETDMGICQLCYGLGENGYLKSIGSNVGVEDGQALTERSCNHAKSIVIVDNQLMSLKELFEKYENLGVAFVDDTEIIDLSEKQIKIYDGNSFVKLNKIGRHLPTAPMKLIKTKEQGDIVCQANHPIPVYESLNICKHCGKKLYKSHVSKNTRTGNSKCVYCRKMSENFYSNDLTEKVYKKKTSYNIRTHLDYIKQSHNIFEEIRKIGEYEKLPLRDYWFGFYLAEGCIKYGKSRKGVPDVKGISIPQKPSKFMEKFGEDHPEFDIKHYGDNLSYTIHNKNFGEKIEKISGRYSHNKKLPNDFINYEDSKLYSILSGLIDGDGYFDTNKKIFAVSSNSYELIHQIQIIGFLLKFNTRITVDSDNGIMGHQGLKIEIKLNEYHLKNLSKSSFKVENNLDSVEMLDYDKPSDKSYISLIRDFKYMEDYVYDVETETGLCQTNFLQNHNTQLTMRTFHSGGAAGTGDTITQGFGRLEQLFKVPQNIENKAVLSRKSGIVESITSHLTGGYEVVISGTSHIVPANLKLNVKKGDYVYRGEKISFGNIKPQELAEIKSFKDAQLSISDDLDKIYGGDFHKKSFETVIRAVSDNALVEDPGDSSFIRGDKVRASHIKKVNKKLISENRKPAKFKEYFKNIDQGPDSEDFLDRLSNVHLKKIIEDMASTRMASNIHGTNPLPGYMYGTEFNDKKEKGFY
jgi:DNA-directed RNA polymerase beta' subunit